MTTRQVRLKKVIEQVGYIAGISLILLFVLLPIVWIALTAFKDTRDAYTLKIIFEPTLNNFRNIFSHPVNLGDKIRNSLIVSLSTLAIAIPLATMAAYIFSRHFFRGRDFLLVWVLTTQFIPPVIILLPYFNIFRRPFAWLPEAWQSTYLLSDLYNLTLLDTHLALVILYLAGATPYAIWLLKGFIDSMPTELEEAAMVDGCSEGQILRHVTFPLVIPGVLVASVFVFISAWNEFIFALVLTDRHAQTVQMGLRAAHTNQGLLWEQMAAAGVIAVLPLLIMSVLIRKYFINGITMGAVK